MKKIVLIHFIILPIFANEYLKGYGYSKSNLSRYEACRIASMSAKRELMEKIKVFIKSSSKMENFELKEDIINTKAQRELSKYTECKEDVGCVYNNKDRYGEVCYKIKKGDINWTK